MTDPQASERLEQWKIKPGETRNPGGMVRGYQSPSRMLRALLGPDSTVETLERMATAARTHPMRRALARELLAACAPRERFAVDRSGQAYPAGLDPEPGRALQRVMDRLEGTPLRRVEVERLEGPRTAAAVMGDIARLMARNPSIARLVALGGSQPGPAAPAVPGGPAGAPDRGPVIEGAATDPAEPASDTVGERGGSPPRPTPPPSETPSDIPDGKSAPDLLRAVVDSSSWGRDPTGHTGSERGQEVTSDDATDSDGGDGEDIEAGSGGPQPGDVGMDGGRDDFADESGDGVAVECDGTGDVDAGGGDSGRVGCRVIPGTAGGTAEHHGDIGGYLDEVGAGLDNELGLEDPIEDDEENA